MLSMKRNSINKRGKKEKHFGIDYYQDQSKTREEKQKDKYFIRIEKYLNKFCLIF